MANLRGVLNWRWAVIAVEVLVAAACFFAGWRLVSNHAAGPIQVHRAAPATGAAPDPFLGIPMAPGRAPTPGGPGLLGLAPGPDLISRLNRDDFAMYRTQWQVIQVLVDGTRQYIEKRVLPALFAG